MNSIGASGRVLFLGEGHYFDFEYEGKRERISISGDSHAKFIKSMQNIPKASFLLARNVSGYDLLVAQHIIITEEAWNELNEWLC